MGFFLGNLIGVLFGIQNYQYLTKKKTSKYKC